MHPFKSSRVAAAFSSILCFSLCPILAQVADTTDPQRTEVVGYLADRSTRELSALLRDWRSANGTAKDDLEAEVADLATERYGYLKEIMQRDPVRAESVFLELQDRIDVDSIVTGTTAQLVAYQGCLNVYSLDDPQGVATTGLMYGLSESNGSRFDLFAGPGVLDGVPPGSDIQVNGYALDDVLTVSSGSSGVTLITSGPILPQGPERDYLAVFVKFKDGIGPIATPLQIQKVYATNQQNVIGFYDAVSFSNIQLSLGFYNDGMPIQLPIDVTNDQYAIRDEVMKLLSADPTFNWQDYYGLVLFFDWSGAIPKPKFFNRGTIGISAFSVKGLFAGNPSNKFKLAIAWMGGSGQNSFHSNAHEIGHNLGSNHSGFWDDVDLTVFDPDNVCDYGDPVSVMGGFNVGSGSTACTNGIGIPDSHWPSIQKMELPESGFIPTSDWVVLNPGEGGQFCLQPISISGQPACNNSAYAPAQAIKMPRGPMDSLYLEFRYPTDGNNPYEDIATLARYGADDGAGILYVRPSQRASAIIDWKAVASAGLPGEPIVPNVANAAMHAGDSFTDPCTGITVTIDSILNSETTHHLHTTITQNPNPCTDFTPPSSVTISGLTPGSTVSGQFTLFVTATDGESGISLIELLAYTREKASPCGPACQPSQCPTPGAQTETCMFTIDTTLMEAGRHGLIARAFDNPAGCCPNASLSEPIYFVVDNGSSSAAPDVALSTPVADSTVIQPFTVDVAASDTDGLASVEYWIDPSYVDLCGVGELHDGVHPDACKYHAFFPAFSRYFAGVDGGRGAFLVGLGTATDLSDTLDGLPPGDYQLWARAIDLLGDEANSVSMSFSVAGTTDFTVSLPFEAGTTFIAGDSYTTNLTTTSDSNEVGYVELLVDGVSAGMDEDAPYSITWVAPLEPGSHTVEAKSYGIGGRTATDSEAIVVN